MTDPQQVTAPTLQQVARKGAVQVFLIGLATDVAVAVAFLVLTQIDAINTTEALIAFGISLAKSVVAAVARYFIRTLMDRSGYNPDGTPKPVSA